jgi:hypothetical protein
VAVIDDGHGQSFLDERYLYGQVEVADSILEVIGMNQYIPTTEFRTVLRMALSVGAFVVLLSCAKIVSGWCNEAIHHE